jgi:hypothetical protein
MYFQISYLDIFNKIFKDLTEGIVQNITYFDMDGVIILNFSVLLHTTTEW